MAGDSASGSLNRDSGHTSFMFLLRGPRLLEGVLLAGVGGVELLANVSSGSRRCVPPMAAMTASWESAFAFERNVSTVILVSVLACHLAHALAILVRPSSAGEHASTSRLRSSTYGIAPGSL